MESCRRDACVSNSATEGCRNCLRDVGQSKGVVVFLLFHYDYDGG